MNSTPVTNDVSVATAIVERIAALEGLDPVDLEVPLYDVIDPDALEALTNAAGDGDACEEFLLEFSYMGYAITVDGSGSIDIE